MGRIANIYDLPFEQKLFIVGVCLSVEFLSELTVELSGKTSEDINEATFQAIKKHVGAEGSHEKINFLLKKFLDSCDLS
ncbi:MAG: hypothetical protein ICV86_18540 [Microcoleus sp. T3-bin5]|nr:hypothetical protein [Microcoleus sp. T3-bin5]